MSLADVEVTYCRWMAGEDPYPLRVVLGTYAANQLEGDPVWTMLVGGSGAGKTEALNALAGCPDVHAASTLSGPAALLSATPKKETQNGATGGLLRKLGERGVLVLKDFTSVISMHREARAEVLAALREVYDGRWDRQVGTDGGRTLTWHGKAGLLAGCTTVFDSAHGVISTMGDRFLLARMPEVPRAEQGRHSLRHAGQEAEMRREISAATGELLANLEAEEAPELAEDDFGWLIATADLASKARSPVQRDHMREIELVLDAEAPTRIAKQLGQLYRGLLWVGMDPAGARALVSRVGMDCIPKLRRAVIDYLAGQGRAKTGDIAEAVEHPTTTTRRTLEDLTAHGVVGRLPGGEGKPDSWWLKQWAIDHIATIRSVPETSGSHNHTEHIDDDKTGKVVSLFRDELGFAELTDADYPADLVGVEP